MKVNSRRSRARCREEACARVIGVPARLNLPEVGGNRFPTSPAPSARPWGPSTTRHSTIGSTYIGCQRVEELDGDRLAYYHTRFWARVELDEFSPEHEMTARRLVAPEEFRATLFWDAETTAGLILERGLTIENGVSRAR